MEHHLQKVLASVGCPASGAPEVPSQSAAQSRLVLGKLVARKAVANGNGRHLTGSPYAVVLLPSLLSRSVSCEDLRLPLNLAYLLSAHVSFRLPMSTANLAHVERTFDEIISGCLGQSKGISYVTSLPDDLGPLLASAVFVLTNEQGFRITHALAEIPQAVLVRSGEVQYLLRVEGAKRVPDVDWKAKLAGCALSLKVPCRTFSARTRFLLTA